MKQFSLQRNLLQRFKHAYHHAQKKESMLVSQILIICIYFKRHEWAFRFPIGTSVFLNMRIDNYLDVLEKYFA